MKSKSFSDSNFGEAGRSGDGAGVGVGEAMGAGGVDGCLIFNVNLINREGLYQSENKNHPITNE